MILFANQWFIIKFDSQKRYLTGFENLLGFSIKNQSIGITIIDLRFC